MILIILFFRWLLNLEEKENLFINNKTEVKSPAAAVHKCSK